MAWMDLRDDDDVFARYPQLYYLCGRRIAIFRNRLNNWVNGSSGSFCYRPK